MKYNVLTMIIILFLVTWLGFDVESEVSARSGGKPRLDIPALSVENSSFIVVSRLKDGFPGELEKTLESGKTIIFYYFLELCRPRFFFFYPDERIWRGTIKYSLYYNTATREYAITRERNGSKEIKYTNNPDDMRKLVNEVRFQLPDVIKPADRSAEYYVKMWLSADTSPLPGSFKTRTINSKRFVPARMLADDDKSRQAQGETTISLRSGH